MTKVLEQRCEELAQEVKNFQAKVYRNYPFLQKSDILQFTLTLTKKGKWKCQCLGLSENVEIGFCKKNFTLLKRLSYLSSRKRLEFAQDSENQNEFHIIITNHTQDKKKGLSKVGQLQFLF